MFACVGGHVDVVRMLLTHGADILPSNNHVSLVFLCTLCLLDKAPSFLKAPVCVCEHCVHIPSCVNSFIPVWLQCVHLMHLILHI